MPELAERARRYHRRAEELRSMVADWKSPETRAMLLRIADAYDKLAAMLGTTTDATAKREG